MLIALEIQKMYNKTFKEKIKALFRHYTIEKNIKSCGDISVMNICYKQYHGDINFKKIYRCTVGESKTILCSDDISLKNTPFQRFNRNEFNLKMMENFVCDVLEQCTEQYDNLKISFFDPDAEFPLFAEKLLRYTSSLNVVSNMPRFYENESERVMNRTGASYIVSNSIERLAPCDILICPPKIKVHLPTTADTIIFTSYKPLVSTKGIVISRYYPEFPEKYLSIKPECTDGLYFLSALYTLCGKSGLGKLDTVKCGNEYFDFLKDDMIYYIMSNADAPAVTV